MKKRTIVLLLAVLTAGAITAINYAGTNTVTTITVSGSDSIAAAAITSGTPSWSPTPGKAGTVTGGGLYKLTSDSASTDINATLYLTNPDSLSKAYSYLNLDIAVYGGTSTDGGSTITWSSTPITDTDTLLSLSNGFVTLPLTGSQYYKIAVTGGSYYCLSVSNSANLSPQFTVDVR